jgi:ubiquinone/menaquinone biosynthesis C-methylase UbiE
MERELDYVLGTDKRELDRLGFQHKVWSEEAFAIWKRAGIGLGDKILDLGCGPGFATWDLAQMVGDTGLVHGIDRSEPYVAYAKHILGNAGFTNVDLHASDFDRMSLPENTFDAAYSRWIFSWLDDPRPTAEKVFRSLKPGGYFLLQEYVHWGAFSVNPERKNIRAAVEACRESWRLMPSEIDIGPQMVEVLADFGMEIVHVQSLTKVGRPGELAWQWPGTFLDIYGAKLIEMGLLTKEQHEAFFEEWVELEAMDSSFVITPLMMEIVARKK